MTTLKGVAFRLGAERLKRLEELETEKGRKKWRICFIFPIYNFHNFSLVDAL